MLEWGRAFATLAIYMRQSDVALRRLVGCLAAAGIAIGVAWLWVALDGEPAPAPRVSQGPPPESAPQASDASLESRIEAPINTASARPGLKRVIHGRVVESVTSLPIRGQVVLDDVSTWSSPETGYFQVESNAMRAVVSAAGYESRDVTIATTNADLVVDLASSVACVIHVADAGGLPVPGASVMLLRDRRSTEGDSARELGKTDRMGILRLNSGATFLVQAVAGPARSAPTLAGPGGTTVTCDVAGCCRVRLFDNADAPVETLVLLETLDGILRMPLATDRNGIGEYMIPRARYSVRVPAFGRLVGLDDAICRPGQLLDVSNVGEVVLCVSSGDAKSLGIFGLDTRKSLPATVLVEILRDGEWHAIATWREAADPKPILLDKLLRFCLTLKTGSHRIRAEAEGYAPAFADSYVLANSPEMWLAKVSSRAIEIHPLQGGRAFPGKLCVRVEDGQGESLSGFAVGSYDGSAGDSLRMDVPVTSCRLGAYASLDFSAGRIDRCEVDRKQDALQWPLPVGGAIRITGAPVDACVGVRSVDGTVCVGHVALGVARVDHLLPGSYRIGPLDVLRFCEAQAECTRDVTVETGQTRDVSWDSLWKAGASLRGHVTLSGGGGGQEPDAKYGSSPAMRIRMCSSAMSCEVVGELASMGASRSRLCRRSHQC